MREPKKYEIEIDLYDHGIDDPHYEGMWRGASHLVASGNDLDELCEGAIVYWCDQDGGEAGETEPTDEMCEMIKIEYFKQLIDETKKQLKKGAF